MGVEETDVAYTIYTPFNQVNCIVIWRNAEQEWVCASDYAKDYIVDL